MVNRVTGFIYDKYCLNIILTELINDLKSPYKESRQLAEDILYDFTLCALDTISDSEYIISNTEKHKVCRFIDKLTHNMEEITDGEFTEFKNIKYGTTWLSLSALATELVVSAIQKCIIEIGLLGSKNRYLDLKEKAEKHERNYFDAFNIARIELGRTINIGNISSAYASIVNIKGRTACTV